MKIIKVHKPSECIWRDSDFCHKADQIHSDCLDDNKFPKDCPLDDHEPKPPNGLVCGWANILPYVNDEVGKAMCLSTLKKKYGPVVTPDQLVSETH